MTKISECKYHEEFIYMRLLQFDVGRMIYSSQFLFCLNLAFIPFQIGSNATYQLCQIIYFFHFLLADLDHDSSSYILSHHRLDQVYDCDFDIVVQSQFHHFRILTHFFFIVHLFDYSILGHYDETPDSHKAFTKYMTTVFHDEK